VDQPEVDEEEDCCLQLGALTPGDEDTFAQYEWNLDE